ncbi:hypothetical protein TTHERM_00036920 (macronuclear) [Tetrahymena thermophila SB210]|uniref:Uncharacterized protein n=1 Tax=Tetrahymena thermophila (strain SB210) TaxID=312017 RepID=Q22MC7_TETTS|nr:hypothetical protein TTHERM_00036920 [Tetrahymena thermophila SB210]EAR86413.2 hypothetical protein TTHERM_00036920 [Tetrahymena thermophila SB210]|eukprot:XP_977093.2 hypothetical protein TTHERM_00036920 [Tetrahymena thermophila SB210]
MKKLNMIIINLEWLMGKSNLHHENSTLGFGMSSLSVFLKSCLIYHNHSSVFNNLQFLMEILVRQFVFGWVEKVVAQASGSSYQAKSYQEYCQGQNAFKKENASETSYEMGDYQKDDKSTPLQIFIFFLNFQIQFLIELFYSYDESKRMQFFQMISSLLCIQRSYSLIKLISNEEIVLTIKSSFFCIGCN